MNHPERNVPWAVTPDKVKTVIQQIIEIGNPKKLFVFGSYLRNETSRNSDLDLLIVADDNIKNTRKESVRIRRALKDVSMPIDILVVREKSFAGLSNVPGLIYKEVLTKGEMVYEKK